MKTIGIIILGVIVLLGIIILTLVMEVIEFFAGAIFFVIAIVFFWYLFQKIKNKVD